MGDREEGGRKEGREREREGQKERKRALVYALRSVHSGVLSAMLLERRKHPLSSRCGAGRFFLPFDCTLDLLF